MDDEALMDLVRDNSARDALGALRSTVEATVELERRTTVLVRRARNEGATWGAIAASLGVSKQAVHKKYGGSRIFRSQP